MSFHSCVQCIDKTRPTQITALQHSKLLPPLQVESCPKPKVVFPALEPNHPWIAALMALLRLFGLHGSWSERWRLAAWLSLAKCRAHLECIGPRNRPLDKFHSEIPCRNWAYGHGHLQDLYNCSCSSQVFSSQFGSSMWKSGCMMCANWGTSNRR